MASETTFPAIGTEPQTGATERAAFKILLAISFCHLLNDAIQSLLPAIYPILKNSFHLDFEEVGLIALTSQVTASSGGLTLTVTRVAPADFGSTRIELTVQNNTATEMKLPLDFDVGNSTFRDDDGHWLPASDFYTGTEWPEIIPAHQSLKGAMGFERQFPARATKATLVLKFDVTDPSHRGPDGITVKDINLGPG